MTVRHLAWSGTFSLALLGGHLVAAEPGRLPASLPAVASPNQHLADTVATRLRDSGVLRDYRVDVAVTGGSVELTGQVASQPQKEEVLRLVQGVPGVVRVVDHLTAREAGVIRPVQNKDMPPKLPPPTPDQAADKGEKKDGAIPEPTPLFRAQLPAYSTLNPPNMPPYAWPTYAPYPNHSRVAYPTHYPYNSWPYIGPVYPYPKVPLGWRSVKLEWNDGHWWYSRVGHPHDWWKMRFW